MASERETVILNSNSCMWLVTTMLNSTRCNVQGPLLLRIRLQILQETKADGNFYLRQKCSFHITIPQHNSFTNFLQFLFRTLYIFKFLIWYLTPIVFSSWPKSGMTRLNRLHTSFKQSFHFHPICNSTDCTYIIWNGEFMRSSLSRCIQTC